MKNIIVDDMPVKGQNPKSAPFVAQKMVELLQNA
jgi:hypothetical protein